MQILINIGISDRCISRASTSISLIINDTTTRKHIKPQLEFVGFRAMDDGTFFQLEVRTEAIDT